MWALRGGGVLFPAGSVFALERAVEELNRPPKLESPRWGIVTPLVGVALECFSFRTALHGVAEERGGGSLWRFIVDTKSPDLAVVRAAHPGHSDFGPADALPTRRVVRK